MVLLIAMAVFFFTPKGYFNFKSTLYPDEPQKVVICNFQSLVRACGLESIKVLFVE